MIPAPDLTEYWITGILGLVVIAVGGFIGGFEKAFPITVAGMIVGFTIIIASLALAVGLNFVDYDGETQLWRAEITEEIKNTECEDMKQLSFDYRNSDIDKFTVNKIREEIKEAFIYNCVDTREGWWQD